MNIKNYVHQSTNNNKQLICKYLLFGLCLFFQIGILFGQKEITLQDICTEYTFYTRSIPDFNFSNDGSYFTRLENNNIIAYNIQSNSISDTVLKGEDIMGKSDFIGSISNYTMNNSQNLILLESEKEQVNRRFIVAKYHIYNIEKKTLNTIYKEGKIMHATFSNDSKKVAFVYENNLYYSELVSGLITQITFDGAQNKLINGRGNWVYEDEFGTSKAFQWSPDSKYIAYVKLDESKVKNHPLIHYDNSGNPHNSTHKYPKEGEIIPSPSVLIYSLEKGNNTLVDLPFSEDFYIPQIQWSYESNGLSISILNRYQNHFRLLMYNPKKNDLSQLIEETSSSYIDYLKHIIFINKKNDFIFSSEYDGYMRLFLYHNAGRDKKLLTPGNYDVTELYGYDNKTGNIFFQAQSEGPLNKYVFRLNLIENTLQQISKTKGVNQFFTSKNFDYYFLKTSTINSAPKYTLFNSKDQKISTIENNERIEILQKEYGVRDIVFYDFFNRDGNRLNGWIMKPQEFPDNKKHPLLLYVYSGPGSQEVVNEWNDTQYWWFQLLASKGYVIACVDTRGTSGRGSKFKKSTYLQLGKLETQDQIDAAEYLSKMPNIDKTRIGVFGWSYGGFLSTNCLLKGNKIFKAAIAIAPVTNWKWYNAVFTEKHMRTYTENKAGYDDTNLLLYTHLLKGNYLLVHGMEDDNVHYQHSVELMKSLIKNNKQFDTYSYPNRNHGIYGNNARLHLYTKMTNFVLEKL